MTNRTDIEISVCYFLIGLDIFLNMHPLLILVLPQRFFRHLRRRRHHNRRRRRRGCARGDLRNRLVAFVRFVPLARSLRSRAESIGVFRDAQRSPQQAARELARSLGKEDASHRRVLLRGEVS